MDAMTPNNTSRPRRGLWIGIGALVVLLLAAVGGGLAVRRGEARQLAAGRTAIADGAWRTAVSDLTAALETQPAFLRQHPAEAAALRGFAHYQLGDDAAALADLDAALAQDLNWPDLHGYRAAVYFRQGEVDAALSASAAALAQAAALPDYLRAQLHAQRVLAADEAADVAADLDAALAAAAHLPDDVLAPLWARRALHAFAAGEAEAALRALAEARALRAPLPDALAARLAAAETAVLATRGDADAVLAASDAALAHAEALPEATLAALYAARADVWLARGALETAVAEAGRAAEYDDTLALPHALRAWQQYRAFAWDDALAAADAALALDDANALAHRVRGSVLAWQGRYADAAAALSRAVELDAADAEAWAMRAFVNSLVSEWALFEADVAAALAADPRSPAALWAGALRDLRQHDDEAAYVRLTQALALDDGRPELYLTRSLSYRTTAEDDARLADIEAALALYADFGPALVEQAVYAYDYDRDDAALAAVAERLIVLWPEWHGGYLLQARVLGPAADQPDYEAAMAALDAALARNERLVAAYLLRGDVYAVQDEPELAREAIAQALALDPRLATAHFDLALLAREEDLAAAIAHAREGLVLFPRSLYGRTLLAELLWLNDEDDAAWQLVHEVLAEDRLNALALLLRAQINLYTGQLAQVLADAQLVIARYPNEAVAYLLRAEALLAQGEIENARRAAEQVLALSDDYPYAAYLLGSIAQAEQAWDEALPYFEQFIAEGEAPSQAYAQLANLYLINGDTETALDLIADGLALADDYEEHLYVDRALVHALLGDEASARADLAVVLEGGTDVDAIARAETELVSLNSRPAVVDGRRVVVDEAAGYSLSYAETWFNEGVDPDGIFTLSLSQEIPAGAANVALAFVPDFPPGFPLAEFAAAIFEGFVEEAVSFEELSLTTTVWGGRNALLREYLITYPGDPDTYHGRHYYLVDRSNLYILIFQVTEGAYAEFTPELDAIAASFALLP